MKDRSTVQLERRLGARGAAGSHPRPDVPTPGRRARTTVVLTASETAADFGAKRLQALLAPRKVRRVRAPVRGPALAWAALFGRDAVWITGTDPAGWLALARDRPDLFRTVHLRPGLMAVRDVLDQLWTRTPVQEDRWADLAARDGVLRTTCTLAEEDLFGASTRLDVDLPVLFGSQGPEAATGAPDVAGYDQVLADALGADPGEPAPAPTWTPSGHFPVRTGGAGLALLGTGWSYAEPDRVWSDSEAPRLLLPSIPSGREMIVRLAGEIARPERGPLRVRAMQDGEVLGSLIRRPGDALQFRLELRVAAGPAPGRRELTLAVDGAVRPGELRAGADGRLLGVALKHIELRDGGRAPTGEVEPLWEELVRRRRPRTALLLGADAAASARVGERLRALGLAVDAVRVGGERSEEGAEADGDTGGLASAASRAELVVLCDAAASQAWFAALSDGPIHAAPGSWHLLLVGGDPALWPEGLEQYALTRSALIHVSDRSTVVEAGAAA